MKMFAGVGFLAALGLVVAPASANLLTNGGFEDTSGAGWSMTTGVYKWYSHTLAEGARTHAPATVEGDRAFEADNGFGPVAATGDQTVALPAGPGFDVTFSGYISTGPGGSDSTNTGTVNVYDGANLVYTASRTNQNGFFPVGTTFTPAFGSVRVEFVATGNAGWSTPAAVHFDAFSLTQVPEPASLGLVALAGLPLVLRRRRSA